MAGPLTESDLPICLHHPALAEAEDFVTVGAKINRISGVDKTPSLGTNIKLRQLNLAVRADRCYILFLSYLQLPFLAERRFDIGNFVFDGSSFAGLNGSLRDDHQRPAEWASHRFTPIQKAAYNFIPALVAFER